jgi:hypothetical protein
VNKWNWGNIDYVTFADAEAEIEKACKEAEFKGWQKGKDAGEAYTFSTFESGIRADERERIEGYFIAEAHYLGQTVIDRIRSCSVQKPKPLVLPQKFDDWQSVGEWLNIVSDAVNELRAHERS